MLACFPCGRSARFTVEPSRAPSSAPKCSPSPEERSYFNDMNKDPCSLIAEVKSHLDMGSSHPKDMDYSSEDKNLIKSIAIDAMTIHDKEFAHPSNVALIHQFDGYREEKEQQLVVSTIVVENGAICGEYNADEGKDDYNIIEDHISSMKTPTKEMTCSKEEKEEDLISSNLEVDFIQDKDLESKQEEKDKLCRKLVSGPADREELLKKAIPEGGKTSCGTRVAQHTDDHQNTKSDYNEINMSGETSSTQDGEDKQGRTVRVADGDYIGCYDKGVISQSKAEPRVLFSYGISDQQRDFLFLCAGLVIQAVGFQLRSIVEVITALILLCYRAYIFGCRFVDTLSRTKQKLVEKHTSLFSQVAIDSTRLALHRERWESMKPLLIQGAKKLGWGCLNAAYVLAMLGALLLTSFLFSYLVVKGGATQKPIHISKELYFDYTKAHPVASLDLFSLDAYSRMANASKGNKVNPGANFRYRYRYRCTILLTLPESDYNRELGVFQVTSELLSEKGETVVKGSQPCMLVFKSKALHYVKSIFMAIPLVTGLASETQTLRLHLLEWHYNANARVLQILLVPRAGHAINTGGLPQIYKAQIQIDSLHSPFIPSSSSSSTILRTLFKWIFLSFLIFGCLASFCMYRMHHKP